MQMHVFMVHGWSAATDQLWGEDGAVEFVAAHQHDEEMVGFEGSLWYSAVRDMFGVAGMMTEKSVMKVCDCYREWVKGGEKKSSGPSKTTVRKSRRLHRGGRAPGRRRRFLGVVGVHQRGEVEEEKGRPFHRRAALVPWLRK